MKLYYHPVSTTCRPIMLLAADDNIKLDYQLVDLFKGEHMKPEYLAINPSHAVPVLEDGDFRLSESSAILKYLAEKTGSRTYPADLRKRARINQMMDWFNTGLYRDLGYGLIYTQVLPPFKHQDDKVQAAVLARSKESAKSWLKILDESLIGPDNAYVGGSEITLADYLGAAYLTLGEVIRLDCSAYPNICRWLATMKARPNWAKVNEGFYTHFVTPYRDAPFEGL